MKKLYPLLLLALVSCSPRLAYVGNYLDATRKVDIYVDESTIQKKVEVIGVVTPDLNYTWAGKNYDEIIAKKAVQKAREVGADAVFFSNYYRKPENKTINRESATIYTDSSIRNRSLVQIVPPAGGTGRQILFLKYR
jgi:hypothetical protein